MGALPANDRLHLVITSFYSLAFPADNYGERLSRVYQFRQSGSIETTGKSDMKIETTVPARIWLVVALCLGVGGSAIGILMNELKATSASYEDTLRNVQECARQQDGARVLQVTFKKQVQEWKDILLRGYHPADLVKYSNQFRAAASQVNEMGAALQKSVTDPGARQATEEFVHAYVAMRVKYEAALQVFTQAKGANAHDADNMVKGQDRAVTDLIDKIVASLVKRAGAAVASEKEAVAQKIWLVSLTVLTAFGLIGVFAGLTIRKISGTLRHAVADLSETARQVASAASQVSVSSLSLAQGATEQAASLEETSASTEEINSIARKNSQNTRGAAELGTQSQQTFVRTNHSLDQMVLAMGDINTQSSKISKIIKTIDGIAFQTNILALNAAVEAARAGEAGLGFAVVADEVRSLAQRCAQAAKDTAQLIEESIAKSIDGKAKVDQVAAGIREITGEAAKVKTLVDEVNLGSQEQARGLEQIGKAILQMEEVTQMTAASAEEGASAASELHAQSESLKQIVDRLAAMVGAADSTSGGEALPGTSRKRGAETSPPAGMFSRTSKSISPVRVPGSAVNRTISLNDDFSDF